jgi:hypothetical protein
LGAARAPGPDFAVPRLPLVPFPKLEPFRGNAYHPRSRKRSEEFRAPAGIRKSGMTEPGAPSYAGK